VEDYRKSPHTSSEPDTTSYSNRNDEADSRGYGQVSTAATYFMCVGRVPELTLIRNAARGIQQPSQANPAVHF
jgi:hypothetical protein